MCYQIHSLLQRDERWSPPSRRCVTSMAARKQWWWRMTATPSYVGTHSLTSRMRWRGWVLEVRGAQNSLWITCWFALSVHYHCRVFFSAMMVSATDGALIHFSWFSYWYQGQFRFRFTYVCFLMLLLKIINNFYLKSNYNTDNDNNNKLLLSLTLQYHIKRDGTI